MLEKIEEKNRLMFWRNSHMKVMLVCLRMYKKTGDNFYIDIARCLGEKSVKLKTELDRLH